MKTLLRVFAIGGSMMSGLSIAILIWEGFAVSWTEPFRLVIEYYDSLVRLAFGWTEPWLTSGLTYVNDRIGLHLHLYSHWRHFFVLLLLCFMAQAKHVWVPGYRLYSLFRLTWGILVALASSVASGSIPLVAGQGDAIGNLLVAIFPLAGYALYGIGEAIIVATFYPIQSISRQKLFSFEVKFYIRAAIVGVIILVCVLTLLSPTYLQMVRSPGLVLIGLFIVMLAIAWIVRGVVSTYERQEKAWQDLGDLAAKRNGVVDISEIPELPSIWGALRSSGAAQVGYLMLSTIGAGLLFVAANAGLQVLRL